MRLTLSEVCRVRSWELLQNFRAARFNLVEMTTRQHACSTRDWLQNYFAARRGHGEMTASDVAKHPECCDVEEETSAATIGTAFQPDEIKLMRSALDEAAIILPKAERTSAMKAKLASRILAAAAKGERDPNKLRIAALLEEESVRNS